MPPGSGFTSSDLGYSDWLDQAPEEIRNAEALMKGESEREQYYRGLLSSPYSNVINTPGERASMQDIADSAHRTMSDAAAHAMWVRHQLAGPTPPRTLTRASGGSIEEDKDMRMRGGTRHFQDGGANPLQRPARSAMPTPPPTYQGGGPMPGGGAQQGAFTAGAPGNSLGAAPGLNPQAIQQALQMRRSMAGGPPAPGGPAGAPAGGWPGTPGMPPGAMMQRPPMPPQGMPPGGPPQGMPPGGAGMGPLPPGAAPSSMGAIAPGAMPPQGPPPGGPPPQAPPPQMQQQALQQAMAQQAMAQQAAMQQQGAQYRPPGMATGGRVQDGETDAKKNRPDRQWGKRVVAEDIPEAPVKKAKGGLKRRKPPAPKIAKAKPPFPMTPGGDDMDAPPPAAPPDMGAPAVAGPPVGMPGMKKGGKWIADATKNKGALHKRLGIPQDEKIPAKTLNKAAQKGGTLGKEANLAKTLKGFKKSKGGECEDKMAKGGISKFNSTKAAPGNLATHPGGGRKFAAGGVSKFNSTKAAPGNLATHPGCGKAKFAAGGVAKVRKGFPNTNKAPKKYAAGGKIRGCGAATKGTKFSGIY